MPGVPSSRGCDACRKQRKKCDELKPKCSRCVRLQLPCIGNGAKRYKFQEPNVSCTTEDQQSTETSIIPECPVDVDQVELTSQERFYLHFFRHNTARQNARYFNSAFWDQLVHQISEVQPAVRHATISMGALHWHYQVQALTGEHSSFPLQQCNKALAYLQQNLAADVSNRTRMETVLISCLVLVGLSFIQGDARAVSCHLTAGWRLLDQWQDAGMDNSPLGALLLEAFTQLQLRWFSLADGAMDSDVTLPDLIASNFPITKPLPTLEESAGFLAVLGWLALQIRSQQEIGIDSKRKGAAVTTLRKLQDWKSRIMESKEIHGDPSQAEKTTLLLDIWTEVISIRIATDDRITDGETRYDSYLPHFRQTIESTKKYLLQAGPETWMAVVTPLVFCALKCRDWRLRHEALQLLTGWPRFQGKWLLFNTNLVVSQVIEIESANLTPHDIIPKDSRVNSLRVEFVPGHPNIRIFYRRPCSVKIASDDMHNEEWESVVMSY